MTSDGTISAYVSTSTA